MNSYELVFSYQGPCDSSTHTSTTTVDDTTRQYTLTGLHEFSNYTINITAVNVGGRSAVTSQSVTTIAAGRSYFGSVLLLAFIVTTRAAGRLQFVIVLDKFVFLTLLAPSNASQ